MLRSEGENPADVQLLGFTQCPFLTGVVIVENRLKVISSTSPSPFLNDLNRFPLSEESLYVNIGPQVTV